MPSEPPVLPVAPPTCGECGALIGDVTAHTAWHAGADRADLRGEILGFLDSIDPAQLAQAALDLNPDGDGIANALAVLKQLAADMP